MIVDLLKAFCQVQGFDEAKTKEVLDFYEANGYYHDPSGSCWGEHSHEETAPVVEEAAVPVEETPAETEEQTSFGPKQPFRRRAD